MNNFQSIVKDDTRAAMHMAVELCEQGDFDSVAEAFKWLMEDRGEDEYEAKMDALLCRLTNGKFSKSRAYDLDFMVSCVNEEFEALYADNLTPPCMGECYVKNTILLRYGGEGCDTYRHELSCGHVIELFCEDPPNYCEVCGKAVKR